MSSAIANMEGLGHPQERSQGGEFGAEFEGRHIGPAAEEQAEMLAALGVASLDQLTAKVVPQSIRFSGSLDLGRYSKPLTEIATLTRLKEIASKNEVFRSYIGCGYYNTLTPTVILRNIIENPGWYTQYTPYQPEISQGRLESLLNFQTMVCDFTGLPVANASLLDEATAAAEAMTLSLQAWRKGEEFSGKPVFLISAGCHPQTIALVETRAECIGVAVQRIAADSKTIPSDDGIFGVLLQYPTSTGEVIDPRPLIAKAQEIGALVTVATDLMALAVMMPPGEMGADIAVGSAQRFGVPLGFGGPHAAFFATKDEFKRLMPGRIIGVSKDSNGNRALRLALQTREQHIRREKATSNICTAQALLANVASMYAVYHGPSGIRAIANRIAGFTAQLAAALNKSGKTVSASAFDTISVTLQREQADAVIAKAEAAKINLRRTDSGVSISLDETVAEADLTELAAIFGAGSSLEAPKANRTLVPAALARTSPYLTHPVFNSYHSETEFLRYCRKLELRDLSLANAMIPLGSCTMKLNSTTEMLPLTWKEFGGLHPFAPRKQWAGYAELFSDLEQMLKAVTGFDAVSLQPNSGAQGEYAGLLAIRNYHLSRGDTHRDVCLIPKSAHGTNPASAVMAGMKVIVVDCDENGNISIADLKAKATEHGARLAALMVTYPSTHGVFEEGIKEITDTVHSLGGQVYMDGANLNALVGLVRSTDIGADVCHINLHKTFCIPHGGGGPGMGPIACRKHLAPFLPGHPKFTEWGGLTESGHKSGPVSAAPYGSASILVISWAYIAMMGAGGLKRASQVAILNANYVSALLQSDFPTLYRGQNGFVAHECILDLRELKKNAGVEVDDVAKRLMDYGFHAPTVSWPVIGTVMVEPTESENKRELDRFVAAMKAIASEARKIVSGEFDKLDNPLKGAPHTAQVVCSDGWARKYSRDLAAFPTAETRDRKFWPSVGRVDGNFGDRNLVCTCPPLDSY